MADSGIDVVKRERRRAALWMAVAMVVVSAISFIAAYHLHAKIEVDPQAKGLAIVETVAGCVAWGAAIGFMRYRKKLILRVDEVDTHD